MRLLTGPGCTRSAAALTFERLEERTLLSTFTVSNLNDAGPGSLRQAIVDANANPNGMAGPDVILFSIPAGSNTILLASGEMDITEDLNIRAPVGTGIVIDAQQNSRIFDVSGPDTDLLLADLTLQNGLTTVAAEEGGAIRSRVVGDSAITLIDCIFQNNATLGSNSYGGAIRTEASRLTITGSTFLNNSTQGALAYGGAVFTLNGSVDVINSTFDGNSTAGSDARGGAIYALSGSVSITDSTISNNETTGTRATGGGLYANIGDVSVVRSTLSGNTTAGLLAHGGGLFARTGAIRVVNSTLSGNMATGNSADGGGIYTDSGQVTVVNSTVTLNVAGDLGGGIAFYANDNGESLTLHNSIVASNQATGASDFTDPGDAATNLIVLHSLISRSDGTSLTPTVGGNYDANFNFIGGATAQTAIDPKLGPLADNGGPTLTHALLPGSFALDWGDTNLAVDVTNGNAPLTVDQRGAPFYRVFGRTVDIGAFEHQPFRTTSGGANAFLTGTAGNDAIVYDAEHQRVNINGLAYPILPGTRLLTIDAGEGSDTVNVIGSTANDLVTADLRTQLVTFTHGRSPNGADARIVGAEVVVIDGNGGNDAATLQDSPGDDKFFARPGSGFFVDLARVLEVDLFRMNLHAQAGGGHNLARLFGSTGIDVLTAQAATSTLMGPGFAHSASGFDFVQVQGGVGTDTATLTGSSGVDALIARAGVAVLTTGGVNVQLDGFETINADGRGGSDFLRLIGSPGNDSLTAFPGSSQFVTNGYNYGFTSFERLTASVAGGGADTAVLIDSVGDDLFVGSGDLAELSGVGFFSRTTGFDVVRIRGVNGGTNTRRVSSINYQLIEQGTWV